MKVVELQLVLLLHRVAYVFMAQVNCSRYGPGDMAVSATCNWTGHVSLSWTTREGIILYYNCTGAVEKSGFYGWAFGTSAHFDIAGWNYHNSTCIIHGCYADDSFATYSIPSVACTVLKPPLPTSTQVSTTVIQTKSLDVSAPIYSYDEFIMNSDESQSTFSIDISEPPRTTSRTQQTPLLILAATVSVAVIASLSFVLLVIGVTSARRKRRKNRYNFDLQLSDGTEVKVKIAPPDIISIASSNESDFDPLVPNKDGGVNDIATAETGNTTILVPDNVSESKTVPIEEDSSDADQEVDSKESSEDVITKEDIEDTADQQDKSKLSHPTYLNISNSARLKFINHTHPPYLRFHPIKTPEDSSTSTFGTSDYVCTTDTSGTYSSNRLDYVLFPDGDFSPSSDDIAEGDEFSSDVLSHEHVFSWGNSPPSGDKSVVSPQHDIGEDPTFDFMRSQPGAALETSSSGVLCQGQVETEQGDISNGGRWSDTCCGESVSEKSECGGFAVTGEDDDVEDVTISGNNRHNVDEINHIRKLNASDEES